MALLTQEMLWSSAWVIQHRTQRIAAAGPLPNARDRREFERMGSEKVAAAAASAAAMARQWGQSETALAQRAARQWWTWSTAWWAALYSASPAQTWARLPRLAAAGSRSARSSLDLAHAAGRLAHSGVRPIHAAVTANVRRLR